MFSYGCHCCEFSLAIRQGLKWLLLLMMNSNACSKGYTKYGGSDDEVDKHVVTPDVIDDVIVTGVIETGVNTCVDDVVVDDEDAIEVKSVADDNTSGDICCRLGDGDDAGRDE